MGSNVYLKIGICCLLLVSASWNGARAQSAHRIDPRDAVSTRLSRENTDEALLRKRLWWNYMDLIADYNKLLNEMQTEELATSTFKGQDALDEVQKFFLDYSVKEELSHPPLPMSTLQEIQKKLEQAQLDLQTAKEEWLRSNHLDEDKADVDLKLLCGRQVLETNPVPGKDMDFYEELIRKCTVHPKTTLHGVVVTYQGTQVIKEEIPAPVAQFISISGASDAAPMPAPTPMPTATPRPLEKRSLHPPGSTVFSIPAPKKVEALNEDEKAQLAVLPSLDGAPLVAPPPKATLVKTAKEILKEFDPQHPQPHPEFGELNLAMEAVSDLRFNTFARMVRYSKALDVYKKALKKYRDADNADADAMERIQKLLVRSHVDFWKPYTMHDALLSDVLVGSGGNCESQSGFIPALVDALQIPLPEGKRLLLQGFNDHIQPVIYDAKTNTVLDLAHRKVFKGTPVPLYDPAFLIQGWLEKQGEKGVRPASDFIVVKANVAPDARLLAKNNPPGGVDSDTIRTLPKPGVLFEKPGLEDAEHASMSAPDILHPLQAEYDEGAQDFKDPKANLVPQQNIDWSQISGISGSMKIDYKKEMLIDGQLKNVEIVWDLNLPHANHFQNLGEVFTFANEADAKYAASLTNDVDLYRFFLTRKLQESKVDLAALDRGLEESISTLRGPLQSIQMPAGVIDVLSLSALKDPLTPKNLRQDVLKEIFPHYEAALAAARTLQQRMQKEHFAFLKEYLDSGNPQGTEPSQERFKPLEAVSSLLVPDQDWDWGTDQANPDKVSWQNNKKTALLRKMIYESMLDSKYVAWTKADLKRSQKEKPEPSPSPELSPSPSTDVLGKASLRHSLNEDASEEASFVPKRPSVVKDPMDVYDALTALKLNDNGDIALSAGQREAVKTLWTQDFTYALFNRIKTRMTSLDIVSIASFRDAFPSAQNCEVYGIDPSGPGDARGSCAPKEVGRLEMLMLEQKLRMKIDTKYLVRLPGGAEVERSAKDIYELLEAQFKHRHLPKWFTDSH